MTYHLDPMRGLSALAICGTGAFAALAEWVINNRESVADMPLAEVAEAAKVSETTVFRLARHLGFSGYREMRVALAELRGVARGQNLSEQWLSKENADPYSAVIHNTVNVHSEILRATAVLADPIALRAAVKAIQEARAIHIFGFGSSTGPVVDLFQRLIRFGYVTNNYSDPHVLTAVTANPPAGSLFFGISFSGQSKDVVDVLTSANRQGFPSVLITSHPRLGRRTARQRGPAFGAGGRGGRQRDRRHAHLAADDHRDDLHRARPRASAQERVPAERRSDRE